jgi:hypothetical protein
MVSYKIEKGIPFPREERNPGLTKVAVTMEVGDSVVTQVRPSVTHLNRKYAPKRFRAAKHNREFRVWRVA